MSWLTTLRLYAKLWSRYLTSFSSRLAATDPLLEFDGRLDDLVTRFTVTPVPRVLYHYTDLRGARGILTSRFFRATHSADTNDPHELRIGDGAFVAATTALLRHQWAECRKTAWGARVRFRSECVREVGDTFLACFTRRRSSYAHFRRFGPVAIGFARLNASCNEPPGQGSVLAAIRYSSDTVSRWLRKGLEDVAGALEEFVTIHGDDAEATKLARVAMLRMGAFANVLGKRAEFGREKEWRLAVIRDRSLPHQVRALGRRRRRRFVECDLAPGEIAEILVRRRYSGRLVPLIRSCLALNGYPAAIPIRVF
jgi:hypothetical protein